MKRLVLRIKVTLILIIVIIGVDALGIYKIEALDYIYNFLFKDSKSGTWVTGVCKTNDGRANLINVEVENISHDKYLTKNNATEITCLDNVKFSKVKPSSEEVFRVIKEKDNFEKLSHLVGKNVFITGSCHSPCKDNCEPVNLSIPGKILGKDKLDYINILDSSRGISYICDQKLLSFRETTPEEVENFELSNRINIENKSAILTAICNDVDGNIYELVSARVKIIEYSGNVLKVGVESQKRVLICDENKYGKVSLTQNLEVSSEKK